MMSLVHVTNWCSCTSDKLKSNKEMMLLQLLVTLALLQLVQLQRITPVNASTLTGLYWVLKMSCNFTGVFCYDQVMEVGSVWAGQSLRSPELRLSLSETSSTPGKTPPFPFSRHTSLTKVCIQDRQTDKTERQLKAAINRQYPLFYTQVWDSVLVQLTLNSSGKKWTEYKTVLLPTMQAVKVN